MASERIGDSTSSTSADVDGSEQRRPRTAAQERDDKGDKGTGNGSGSSGDKAASSSDPDTLVAEIEATREDLAETLDAIADKVSPKRVAQRGQERAKEVAAQAKETVAAKAATVKETVAEKAATARSAVQERSSGASSNASSVRVDDPSALPPTTGVEVPRLSPAPSASSGSSSGPAWPAQLSSGSVPKEVLAGGVAALLALLLLLRRRRNR